MSDETKLPWPGYRLREGWRMLAGDENGLPGDVFTATCNEPSGDWTDWFGQNSKVSIYNGSLVVCRRTNPNAILPPVEPIPVEPVQPEPGDDVLRALEIVGDTIADMRRERDALQKQVDAHEAARVDWMHEAELWSNKVSMLLEDRDALRKQVEKLTLEYGEACKENGIVRVERDALKSQLELLTEHNEQLRAELCTPKNSARDWRAELRPCWFTGRDDSGFFHGWMRDCDGSIVAIVELPTGLIDRWSAQDVRFTKPAILQEPQS